MSEKAKRIDALKHEQVNARERFSTGLVGGFQKFGVSRNVDSIKHPVLGA